MLVAPGAPNLLQPELRDDGFLAGPGRRKMKPS